MILQSNVEPSIKISLELILIMVKKCKEITFTIKFLRENLIEMIDRIGKEEVTKKTFLFYQDIIVFQFYLDYRTMEDTDLQETFSYNQYSPQGSFIVLHVLVYHDLS